jgi:hypothetical protein
MTENISLIDKFHEFEIKYRLFDLQTEGGIYWWDIVRFDVYEIINYNANEKIIQYRGPGDNKKITRVARFLLKDFAYIVKKYFNRNDYLFLLNPRDRSEEGYSIDYICEAAVKLLHKNSFLIDGFLTNNTKEGMYLNTLQRIFRVFYIKRNKKFDLDINEINSIFQKEFNITFNFKNRIDMRISNFQSDLKYYSYFFKVVKPKIVFFQASGEQKGLLYACKERNIKTVEFQHGQINKFHVYYSYPESLTFDDLRTNPDVLLSFSSYWHKVNYPVKKKVEVGSAKYDSNFKGQGKNITIVCSSIHMEELTPLIHKLSLGICDRRIIVKLHPMQKNEVSHIKRTWEKYKNIDVVFNEKSIFDIYKECSSVVLIQSTAAYEALNFGLKVFVYKKQDYKTYIELFDNENVYLVDNAKDIENNLDEEFVISDDADIFFKKFNRNSFTRIVKELE